MKKVLCGVLTLIIVLGCLVPCGATTVSKPEMGFVYILSDNWVQDASYENEVLYSHINGNEFLGISVTPGANAYSIELTDEQTLKGICDENFSDSLLAKDLSEDNGGAFVTVKSTSVLSSYEYYGGNRYYRYQKAYTASAYGYKDTPFYLTAFITIKNGRVYVIEYERNYESNNFEDIYSMLHSISFESGEIKIVVNGERVVSDSAPVIVDDRTLVPIRAVAEKLGYSVSWDATNEIVALTASGFSNILHYEIGVDFALRNMSERINLDVPPMILGSRTYLPLRAVAESMNAQVSWDGNTRTVYING